MSRKRKILLAVVVILLLAAAAAVGLARASERGVEVRASVVGERDLVSTITATGQVRARREVNISSDVMGRVVELNVDEGDEVEQGQLLLRIDPSQHRAALARARAALSQALAQAAQQRANLLQAERERDRLVSLHDRDANLVSAQALEEAQTRVEVQQALLESAQHGVEQAQAGLDEAQDQLEKTTIRSPLTGRVTRRNIQEGETVVIGTMNNPGSLLLTVSDLSVVEAVLSVDETDIPLVSLGDSAVVELDAFPGQRFAGRVAKIGNSSIQPAGSGGQSAQGSVDFEVILTLLDPPEALRPDLSATADIIVDSRAGALAVPIISVTTRDEEGDQATASSGDTADEGPRGVIARGERPRRVEGVFLIRNGRAVWQPVELGITGQEYFEVTSGVSAGDSIVSGPFQQIRDLSDGAAIRVTVPSPAPR